MEAKKREIMLCGLVHDVKTDISVPGMNDADRKCRPGIQTSLPSCKPDRDPALGKHRCSIFAKYLAKAAETGSQNRMAPDAAQPTRV